MRQQQLQLRKQRHVRRIHESEVQTTEYAPAHDGLKHEMSDILDEIRTITCDQHAQAARVESMTDGFIAIQGCCDTLLDRVEHDVTTIDT